MPKELTCVGEGMGALLSLVSQHSYDSELNQREAWAISTCNSARSLYSETSRELGDTE